jgi:ferredoxin-NADP reductase
MSTSFLALPDYRVARSLPTANATLAGFAEVTATLGVFTVVADRPITGFKPGQYVSVGIVDGGELVQRPYSIVSLGAGGTRVELYIRRLPNGCFSNLLWTQRPPARLVIGPPKGLFTLDSADRRPRIMVGAGTGLAPLLAMLDAAEGDDVRTPTVLIHGVSSQGELAFRARIRSHGAVDYRPTVSRPDDRRNAGWKGLTGRVDRQLELLLDEWRWLRAGGSVAYLCGNPDMIVDCTSVLRASHFDEGDIRAEHFEPRTTPIRVG